MNAPIEPDYLSDPACAMVPPHSMEAEQSVLGGLLIDNTAWERASEQITASSFYRGDHREIFTAISSLIAASKPADVITVFEQLQRIGKAEDCGGLKYLHDLAQSVPSAANLRRYAEIVRERSVERALIRESGAIIELARAPGISVADKVDKAQAAFASLAVQRSGTRDPVPIDPAVAELLQSVQDDAEGKNPALSTGIRNFDRTTGGGIRPGELWVVGARPKMGKTALALALMRNISRDRGTLYLSMEMPVLQLTMRHAAALGSINLQDLRAPDPNDDEFWSRLAKAVDAMRTLAMVHDSQGGLTLRDVRRKLIQARRRQSIDVVFVDFLQLMVGNGDNRNAELDSITNGLKAMAMEFKVGVVLMSQLNRKADDRNGPPLMGDLRDSGAIEAAADLIGMLWRAAVNNPTDENKRHAQLEIVAQRNGPTGSVHLKFIGEYQQFHDWPSDEPVPSQRSHTARAASSRSFE